LDITGNYSISSTSLGGERGYTALVVNLNGTGDQIIYCEEGGVGDRVNINKTSGTLTVANDLALNGWAYTQGTVSGLDTHTLSFEDDTYGVFTPGSLTYSNIEINKTTHSSTWDQLTVGSGTLTISGSFNLTEGEVIMSTNDPTVSVSGSVTIGSLGELSATSNTMTVNGNWTNSGTFSHGNGTVIFAGTDTATLTSGASSFYNIELNKTRDYGFYNDFVISGTVTVVGNLTHTDGEFRDGQINLTGNYIIAAGSDGAPSVSASTIINMNSSTDQSIIYNTGGIGDDIHVDKSSGTLTISSDIIINGWTYVQGTVMGLDNYTLIFGDDRLGYFSPGSLAYSDIEINKTNHNGIYDNVSVSGTVNLTGNLIHTEGEFNGGQFNISSGNYIVTATADGSQSGSASTIMNFNGTGDQSVVYSEGGVAAHIRIDKPSGNLYVTDNMVVHDWTYVQGNIPNIDIYTLVLGDGGQSYFTPASLTYGNIEIYKTEHNGVYDDLYMTAGTLLKINR